jgi:hypothetical protein
MRVMRFLASSSGNTTTWFAHHRLPSVEMPERWRGRFKSLGYREDEPLNQHVVPVFGAIEAPHRTTGLPLPPRGRETAL